MVQNLTYGINVSIAFKMGSSGGGGVITIPLPPNSTIVGNSTTLDLSVPTLPGLVTISGRVTDALGNGIANTSVSATSQSITGAPNLSISVGAVTDANGNYSMVVYSGTNYQITYTPPRPPS